MGGWQTHVPLLSFSWHNFKLHSIHIGLYVFLCSFNCSVFEYQLPSRNRRNELLVLLVRETRRRKDMPGYGRIHFSIFSFIFIPTPKELERQFFYLPRFSKHTTNSSSNVTRKYSNHATCLAYSPLFRVKEWERKIEKKERRKKNYGCCIRVPYTSHGYLKSWLLKMRNRMCGSQAHSREL